MNFIYTRIALLIIFTVLMNSLCLCPGNAFGNDGSGKPMHDDAFSISKNPFTYSGYYHDAESGLFYVKARYYSPEYGTFTSRDSYDLPDRYAYCEGNPVNGIDPDGHLSYRGLAGAGIGALVGAGLGWGASLIGCSDEVSDAIGILAAGCLGYYGYRKGAGGRVIRSELKKGINIKLGTIPEAAPPPVTQHILSYVVTASHPIIEFNTIALEKFMICERLEPFEYCLPGTVFDKPIEGLDDIVRHIQFVPIGEIDSKTCLMRLELLLFNENPAIQPGYWREDSLVDKRMGNLMNFINQKNPLYKGFVPSDMESRLDSENNYFLVRKMRHSIDLHILAHDDRIGWDSGRYPLSRLLLSPGGNFNISIVHVMDANIYSALMRIGIPSP